MNAPHAQPRYRSGAPVLQIRTRAGGILWEATEHAPDWLGGDLRDAVLDDIEFDGGVTGPDTSLAGASLKRCDFYWLLAHDMDFAGADLEDCVFRGCALSAANFTGARLVRTRFAKDNLGGRTDLSGANLAGALIVGADFRGAEYDTATQFPPRFDPAAYGLCKAKRSE